MRKFETDYFLLVKIITGKRVLSFSKGIVEASPGQYMFIPPGIYDLKTGNAGDDFYESDWLAWDCSLRINDPNYSTDFSNDNSQPLTVMGWDEGFDDIFARSCNAVRQSSLSSSLLTRHRILEVIVALASYGIHMPSLFSQNLSSKIRILVRGDFSRQWRSQDFAEIFKISESTMRRQLAAEGVSLRQVILDCRLWNGMALLQSTDFLISRIAFECGYESASQFTARFKEKFGLLPTAVRGGG